MLARAASTGRRLAEMDGARGILSMWVLLVHVIYLSGYLLDTIDPAYRAVLYGQEAVDVFIIMSGFVIFRLLSLKSEPYRVYIVRRFMRMFPVFLVCLAFAIAVRPLMWELLQELPYPVERAQRMQVAMMQSEDESFWLHLATHLTLLHGVIPDAKFPFSTLALLAPSWSISLEWQFYLIAPVVFALLKKKNRWWTAALVVLTIVVAMVGFYVFSSKYYAPSFLPIRVQFFAMGILSWFIWERWSGEDGKAVVRADLLIWLFPLVYFLTSSPAMTMWFVLLMATFAGQRDQVRGLGSGMSWVLKRKTLVYLGDTSFSMYLSHMTCIYVCQWVLHRMYPEISREGMFPLLLLPSLISSLIITALLNHYIEKPGMDLGKRWGNHLNRHTARQGVVAVSQH